MSACLNDDQLRLLADCAPAAVPRWASAHVSGCAACSARLEAFRATASAGPVAKPPSSELVDPTWVSSDGPSSGAPLPVSLNEGDKVGRYVILERIGAGGMGEVYAAFDPELDRKVALKFLRADKAWGAGSEEARTRLLREAQAMARLSHPNVVAVHDVGSVGEEVFVAMEFLDGRPLSDWFREPGRTTKEILAAFIEAGRGLAAAHAAGLVHRDFKPANVVVTVTGRICVLDFGLARAIVPGPAAHAGAAPSGQIGETSSTQPSGAFGTPAYMAPEALKGEAFDALSDQFSFCVSLYEALHGVRPFDTETVGERIAQIESGVLVRPEIEPRLPRRVVRALRRGLAPKPQDRFPNLPALLDALSPPPPPLRRKVAAASAVAVVLVSAAGLWKQTAGNPCSGGAARVEEFWSAERHAALREAFGRSGLPFASDAAAGANLAFEAFSYNWLTAWRGTCEPSERPEPEELRSLRRVCLERRLEEATAMVRLLERADAATVHHAVRAAEAATTLESCRGTAAQFAALLPPQDPESAAQAAALRSRLAEVNALLLAGKYREGHQAIAPLVAEAEALGFAPLETEVLRTAGRLAGLNADVAAAERHFHCAARRAHAGALPRELARAWLGLARLLTSRVELLDRAALWISYAEAGVALVAPDPELEAELAHAQALFHMESGRYTEALPFATRALEQYEVLHGEAHLEVAELLNVLALTLSWLGHHEEAQQHGERGLRIMEALLGPDHPEVARCMDDLGTIEDELARYDSARRRLERALRIRERAHGERHPELVSNLNRLGIVLTHLGLHAEAEAVFRRGLELMRGFSEPNDPLMSKLNHSWGESLLAQGRFAEALEQFENGLAIVSSTTSAEHPRNAYLLTGVGEAQLGLGRPAAAVPLLERALTLRESTGILPLEVGRTRAALARALWESQGSSDRARALVGQARADFRTAGPRAARELEQLETWARARAVEPVAASR